jgi:hypothetical protein
MLRAGFLFLVALVSSPAFAGDALVFPVAGEWLALTGMTVTRNTQYGLELVPLDPYGRPAATCLNEPVLSPSDGVVVEVLDDYPNVRQPGQNRYGNHIVIQRNSEQFIVLGSLARGSLKVARGDHVTAGQPLAACGFSGDSGRSALHVHMQSGPDILGTDSPGAPMLFSNLNVRTPGGCYATAQLYPGQGTC